MRYFFVIVCCLALTGCASVPVKQDPPLDQLKYGMHKEEMIALLGRPQAMEIYKKPDETRVEFDIYLTPHGEKVPVCLIDNKVMGWGKTFYEDHVSEDDIRLK